jgi:hypothetical protein
MKNLNQISIPFVSCGALLAACSHDVQCSTTGHSPDGRWTLITCDETWDGPGVGAYVSSIRMARTDAPRNSIEILGYSTLTRPKVLWKSNYDLVIQIADPDHLLFQAVKLADVRITVEPPKAPDTAGAPSSNTNTNR